jgi:hypothetical protein
MPNFDVNSYLTERLNNATNDKQLEIARAAQAKTAELSFKRAEFEAQKQAEQKALEDSWVGQLGLTPGGFVANRVNDAASLVSGASRLVGQTASLPSSLSSIGERTDLNEEDFQAYNRYVSGKPELGDSTKLNRMVNGQTVFTKFKNSESQRDEARGIATAFDVNGIVEQKNRKALADDLGKNFDAQWGSVKTGAEQTQNGEVLAGAGNVVKGLAGLLYSAGAATLSNPAGVREYILENAPQLLVGAAGKAGQAGMAASNVGYAADVYQQGLENYAKANGGQLPSEARRQEMAMQAASLALAEQAGDVATLGLGKAASEMTRNGFKNTLKAAAGGFASEAPTEGYQTYTEGQITGKPATAKEIYTSGVIGGASGAGLAGGLRAAAEITGATPEKQAERAVEETKRDVFAEAVASGNVDSFTNPASKNFNPELAIQALQAHADQDDKTPEVKQAKFEQATQVVADLEKRLGSMKSTLSLNTKEGLEADLAEAQGMLATIDPTDTDTLAAVKVWVDGAQAKLDSFDAKKSAESTAATRTQIAQLEEQIGKSKSSLALFNTSLQSRDLDTEVEAGKITAADPVASQDAATKIINLSMAIPERLNEKTAERLAKDTTNGLTDAQRNYFREFSAARAQENSLMTLGKVSQEIYFGRPAKGKDVPRMLGIKDYRKELSTALASGDTQRADRFMGYLEQFRDDHEAKAKLAAEAFAATKGDKTTRRLIKTADGWQVKTGTWINEAARLKNGGLNITTGSASLPLEIRTEADALSAAYAELDAAYKLVFGEANVQNVPPTESNEATAQPTESTQKASDSEGSGDAGKGSAESTVQSSEPAAADQASKEAGVVTDAVEASGSSANTAETEDTQSTETTSVELQSTEETESTTDSQPEASTSETAPEGQVEGTVVSGSLLALKDKAPEGATYEKLKFGDLFVQNKGDEDGSTRPLVAVKNFFTLVADKTVSALDYIKGQDELTTKQVLLMSALQDRLTEWSPKITSNLVPTPSEFFNYQDPIRYLISKYDGKTDDLEENVKAAMVAAVFSFVADQAGRVRINGQEAINGILNRQKDTPVDPLAYQMLGKVGVYQHILADTLGAKVLDALGVKGNAATAGQDLEAKLRVSLGAHVLKLMEDVKIVESTTYTNGEMAQLSDAISGNAQNKGHVFFKIKEDSDNNLTGEGKKIYDMMRGTESFLNRLLGMEEAVKFAYLAPSEEVQRTTKSGMGIPKFLQKVLDQKRKEPWVINAQPYSVLAQFDLEQAHEIFGVTDITSDNTHADDMLSKEAKNEGLIREYALFSEFIGDMLATSKDVLKTPFYLGFNVWEQQRVGVETSAVNPQGSKIVRWLITAPSWDTTIALSDAKTLRTFKLKAAEGFGIKPEKGDSKKAEEKLANMVQQPRIAAGLKAVQKALAKEELSNGEKQYILNAVADGGQRAHTFAAMVAYAQYMTAMEAGQSEFTTNLMGEVDGVSNGTVLNHALYGAAKTAEALNNMLESGGIYALTSEFRQYNLWRGTPGNYDTYEASADNTAKLLKSRSPEIIAALWATGGALLQEDGSVGGEGRNLMKAGINPINYGSGINSIKDKMSGQYLETIREKLANLSSDEADQSEVDAYIEQLNVVLAKGGVPVLKVGLPIKSYMGYEKLTFTPAQINALKEVYTDYMGETVSGVIAKKFDSLLRATRTGVAESNVMFAIYRGLYEAERKVVLESVPKKSNGQPMRDLTANEEKAIREKLKDVLPVINTAMSAAERNPDDGVVMMDRESSTQSGPYKLEVRFGQALAGGSKQMTLRAQGTNMSSPGVAMVANTTQSTDSRISHLSQSGRQVFNMHDALGDGVGTLAETALELNKNTWLSLLEYSPLRETHEGLIRMVQGVVAMNMAGNLTPEAIKSVREQIQFMQPMGSEMGPQEWFNAKVNDTFLQAVHSERTKLQAMAQWAVVDQYTFDGGSYQVTDENREAAQQRADTLPTDMDVRHKELLADFNTLVYGKPQAKFVETTGTVTPFGTLGAPKVEANSAIEKLFAQNGGEVTVAQMVEFLKLPNRLNKVNRKLLGLAARAIQKADPKLTLKLITPNTKEGDVLAMPTTPSHAWYVRTEDGKSGAYFLSPEFADSGLTTEAVLHEMVHAALASLVANPGVKDGATELVAELETLRQEAARYVAAAGGELSRFDAAVFNIQEFLAWGMTNADFQNTVLREIKLEKRTTLGNRFVTAMQEFIAKLSELLFRKDPEVNNGLTVLVENTAGLFMAAGEKDTQTAPAELNLSQAAQPQRIYTTQEVFDGLDNGAVSPSFGSHLAKVLGGIVNGVYGPYGAFREAMRASEAGNPMAVWLKAMETGKAPFASEIVNSGLAGSAQEDFVMEQVEATVATALDIAEITTKPAYRELYKLYTEAESTLTPQDFVNAGFTEADYDFVFGLKDQNGERSAYLSRFAALGLANERFNKLLDFKTVEGTAALGNAKSIFDRLVRWFEKILAQFNRLATKTYAGQAANEKLGALVDRLMDIEAKNRFKVEARQSAYNKYGSMIEDATKGVVDATKQKVLDIVRSPIVQDSSSGLVRWAGAIAQVSASGKAVAVMSALRSLRDHAMDERDGILAGLLREAKGPSELLQTMLMVTKHSENLRQNAIGQTGDVLMKEFEAGGQNLSMEEKSALTSVFLRSGAHNLMGKFSLAEIAQMLRDPSALATAIQDVESQLTSVLKDQHIEQAHGLGYWKATELNSLPWLMKNAHVISRMLGTQFAGKITSQEAATQEPIIAQLATLYAIKYSKPAELKAAHKVLSHEIRRTDGNAVELLLELHRSMEQESKERLFNNNPVQMIHGYTPEIYDPYVTIQVANELDGKNLIAQGFKQGSSVAADKDVPDGNGAYGVRQHIYIRRDGGLNRRVSGAMSLTSKHAEGTQIHNGYTNTNTHLGTLNASMQAEVTNKKQMALAAQGNPHRDMSKTKQVNVAPVYDENGNVVNWSYMMSGATKDSILKRENRVEKVLGTLAGSIMDKHTGKELNERAITALRDQYDVENAVTPWSYIEVGAQSSDPEMRELWNLLPQETRMAVRKIWGQDSMQVRKDSLDGIFGYRKVSASDFLMKERADLEGISKFAREVFHSFAMSRGMSPEDADNFAKRMGVAVLKGERGWQEVYKEVKDIVVVKNLVTLMGNIYSNSSLLWLLGVKDAWTHQLTALRGIMAYEKDHKRLMELEMKLAAGYSGTDKRAAEREVVRLKDAIARNPVTKLVDAGLMPTIVEDVDLQDDPYSYKSGLAKSLEAYTDKVPDAVKKLGKTIYMTHDTPLYKVLSRATQYSDFVARYAMYTHLIENEGMDHNKAISKSLNAFVHYDVPMQRNLQYLDDMGFTPFMKYFYRIQRVLLDTMKERPARVLGMVLMNRLVNLGPIVLDSSLVSHAGNMPFKGGPLKFGSVLDELLTVQAGMALVK